MRCHILALTVLLTITMSLSASEPSDSVELIHNRQQLTSRLRLATPDGKVSCADLFRGISRFNGYDDTLLADALPETRFGLDGKIARCCRAVFNWLLSPCVRCDIQRVSNKAKSLEITVDRAAAQRSVNRIKAHIRSVCSQIDLRRERPVYGIQLPPGPLRTRDMVVLIHGLNSRPEDLSALMKIVPGAKLTPATFRYPNDQPIEASAKLLSVELKSLKVQYPTCQVRLVTHSMGGLVARAAIETRELDPGNVSQLIMIAPPNQGSTLARIAAVMDCYEYFTSGTRRGAGWLTESVLDGLGEATADLEPQSVFLDRLNAGPRNPHVRYTILLGTQGPLEPAEAEALRRNFRSFSDHGAYLRFAASKINAALADLDEVVDGLGDGVVSLKRGQLAGVDDVVTLPFSHQSVLDRRPHASRLAYRVIQQRLLSR